MTVKNFEIGIQRLYYVVWAVIGVGFTIAVINEGWVRGHARSLSDHLQFVGIILCFTLGPGILMYAVRWIYRGFVPKAAT